MKSLIKVFVTLSVLAPVAFVGPSLSAAPKKDQARVLIIGDSISIGYTPFVRDMFQGRAEVVHNQGNAQHTGTGLEKIDAWLGDGDWDVIHFNWGLWDLCYRHPDSKNQGNRDKERGTLTTSLEDYEANLEKLVTRLKKTGAKLVWGNTSFVPPGELGRKEGDELNYNRVAARIMQRNGIPINDIRSLTASFAPELFRAAGDVHYTDAGYQAIAVQVLNTIESVMPELEFRVGMIGLDTSHVVAFTKSFNEVGGADHVAGAKVVAAFKGGSPDIANSYERIDGFTKTLVENYGVKLYDSIEEMCKHVDAVLLESVDGRPHLEQVIPVFKAGLPVFIDKPIAGSLKDAITIYQLSKKYDVPCWSSSSLRFDPGIAEVATADIGELKGVISYGPATLEEHHPDLFWYGIHPTEALFTVMGTGVKTVSRTFTPDNDVITGLWDSGKVGVLYAIRNSKTDYGLTAFGTKKIFQVTRRGKYTQMLEEIVQFYRTRVAPVPLEDTIEIYGFMEAADESKRRGGAPVSVAEVLKANGWKN
ncbi:MAG: Gfo/Idh/MocA family oxidoreductase [Verrucomicrobiae bacterium]|nr:Gfo/Idh/MocA family oxidoreductase [Verrucomicrobiae bacterium]